MRYLDTGDRDPSNSLGHWLNTVLADDITEIRIQTGFFSLDGIAPLIDTLERAREGRLTVKILIGSNDMSTLRDDVSLLADIVGIPREMAHLGIVSFSGGYFHPKTYHFTRADGSQIAFVGSANLSVSGLALHVEAGVALDTWDGDNPHQLEQIASAIDSWFTEARTGLTIITGQGTLDELVESGVLALTPPPRQNINTGGATGGRRDPRPRLSQMIPLPAVNLQRRERAQRTAAVQPLNIAVQRLTSVPRDGFPPYLLFEPNAIGPTENASAITGATLPGDAAGLVVQLNRDSARHFMGGTGTANISIPVPTVSTLRFGTRGRHNRPAGLFNLHLRYVGDDVFFDGGISKTSLMAYGFAEGETGHGDIRIVVPAAARRLGEVVEEAGHSSPTAGDLAILEWPTLQDPAFRITFVETDSQLCMQVNQIYRTAEAAGELVGRGACWLPPGISPQW